MLLPSVIPIEELGSALGLLRSADTIALLLATPLFGVMLDAYGVTPVLLASAVVLLRAGIA